MPRPDRPEDSPVGLPADHPDVLRMLRDGSAVDTTGGRGPLPPGVGVNLAALAADVTEDEFQRAVIAHAEAREWRVYSVPDSRRASDAGWPDLVLGHAMKGVVFAELKTATGRTRDAQRWWLNLLASAGCRVFVWRPTDWTQIREVLG